MARTAEKAQILEPLPWLPVLETGHEAIDREHRELIGDANLIQTMVGEQQPWPDLVAAARAMRDRCRDHFANEDHILRATRYPDCDRHRRSHYRIMAEINGILVELETAEEPTRLHWELALSLRGILLDHMLRDDLKYKSHLMQHEPPRGAGR